MSIKVYRADGSTRSLWQRPFARVLRQHKVLPVRGSHVVAITEGPHTGYFHADFSPLAELTKDPRYAVCLRAVFETHEDAVAAEREWLLRTWMLGD